ncbi:hypothetical protein K8354_13225 [Polaribacter litorisediminis]|uniref:hypothetical protein n=1 Tax=Polaribacter litorisediminis TaxID=1908341 RepID=UPI001CC14109|nr:hypothetical protein [Polaribacter litorisediminis]UAM97275.1 hypothetical protein K8354_13225 [Polaribacter litorisediminis]
MEKKRKYWSCIKKNTDFYDVPKEKQLEILVEAGVYVSMTVASSSELNVKEGFLYLPDLGIEKKPNQELKDEFYEYILEIYQVDIDTYFYVFFKEFNDRIFGMEHRDQRLIAIDIFREIYDLINVKLDFQNKEISKNGIENAKEFNRFLKLKGMRNGVRSTLATYENLIPYLSGDEAYFKSSKFKEDETFLHMLYFEKQLKVLISLNDRYQFIEDLAFSKFGKLKDAYQVYQNLFVSFDVFVWVEYKIDNFTEEKPSHIESLYQSLRDLEKVSGTKKLFMDYVNNRHEMNMTKIRNYSEKNNRKHDFRVQKFREELKNLTLKN